MARTTRVCGAAWHQHTSASPGLGPLFATWAGPSQPRHVRGSAVCIDPAPAPFPALQDSHVHYAVSVITYVAGHRIDAMTAK